MRVIPLSEPLMAGHEWKYIKECLDTGWVSSVGKFVGDFERKVAQYIGCPFAVATVNGTAALHLSLIASDISPRDEVIVPTLTFIAPINVVRYCGANPIFMDCEKETLCLDIGKASDFLTQECVRKRNGFVYNKRTKRRVKAILPVHVFGHPVDMDPLVKLAKKFHISIIEDATESIGSEYKGKMTASFGETGCLSFNGNKIITTGGGGMVVTHKRELANRIRHLSTQAKKDPWEYDHDEIGYNYRLTNIQAAMGVAQMEKLEDFIQTKRKNIVLYRQLLSQVEGVSLLWERPSVRSNFWFYTLKVPRVHKKPLLKSLLARDIAVRPIWRLIHTLPMYRDFQSYKIEEATKAYETCFNLPCSVGLKEDDIHFIAGRIKKYFKK